MFILNVNPSMNALAAGAGLGNLQAQRRDTESEISNLEGEKESAEATEAEPDEPETQIVTGGDQSEEITTSRRVSSNSGEASSIQSRIDEAQLRLGTLDGEIAKMRATDGAQTQTAAVQAVATQREATRIQATKNGQAT